MYRKIATRRLVRQICGHTAFPYIASESRRNSAKKNGHDFLLQVLAVEAFASHISEHTRYNNTENVKNACILLHP